MGMQIDRDIEWKPMMKKINDKLDALKDEIGLVKSNTEAQLDLIDKVLKKVK